MTASTTMTIRVPLEIRAKLERLAADTRRSKSFLAAEAVASYVDRELAILDGIRHGLADMAAGRLVAHDVAMAEIDAIVAAAEMGQDSDQDTDKA